jgi:PKD-like domain
MKSFALIIYAFFIYGSLSAAGISSIEGPSSPCPNKSLTYKVEFVMVAGPYVSEVVYKVIWEFTQNGTVVYSKSVNTSFSGIFGTLSHTFSGLPAGPTKLKVTLEYITLTLGGPIPGSSSKTKEFYVGIKPPETIDGNNICPGGSGVLSIATLTNAASYTWEVPAGWRVNGILGPVVANQSTVVVIKPCSDSTCAPQAFSSYTIKVKGTSATCGDGSYFSKTFSIDYPFTISESAPSSTQGKLSVSMSTFPSYSWSTPSSWTNISGATTGAVTFTHNKVSGQALLTTTTPCNNTYTRAYYFVPPAQPGDPGWPGDPGNPDPCDPNAPVTPSLSARSANLVFLRDPCGEVIQYAALYEFGSLKRITLTPNDNGYEFDVSNLKAGVYIMNVKTASGKHKTVKFIKLD